MKAADKLKQLQAQLKDAIDNLEATEFFAKIPDVIRERTLNGIGVNDSGNLTPLPRLKMSTMERRLYLDNIGELSPLTTPVTSNVTESGNLLSSIRMKRSKKMYVIDFDNRKKKNGITPTKINEYLEEKGFVFLELANVERDLLSERIAKKLNKTIVKIFK